MQANSPFFKYSKFCHIEIYHFKVCFVTTFFFSVDLNAADTGVQLKTQIVSPDRKPSKDTKQGDGCAC